MKRKKKKKTIKPKNKIMKKKIFKKNIRIYNRFT